MIFDYNPWQSDVDADLIVKLYKEVGYSLDKKTNMEFIESLSSKQQEFFNSLGIDLTKIEVDKIIYDIPEDEETPALKICRLFANFLIRGRILALPQYQKDLYSDEEVFGKKFPGSVKVFFFF